MDDLTGRTQPGLDDARAPTRPRLRAPRPALGDLDHVGRHHA